MKSTQYLLEKIQRCGLTATVDIYSDGMTCSIWGKPANDGMEPLISKCKDKLLYKAVSRAFQAVPKNLKKGEQGI